MSKIMLPKADFLKKEQPKKEIHGMSLLSMLAIVIIALNAMSWIGLMGIKKNGGKLPWE